MKTTITTLIVLAAALLSAAVMNEGINAEEYYGYYESFNSGPVLRDTRIVKNPVIEENVYQLLEEKLPERDIRIKMPEMRESGLDEQFDGISVPERDIRIKMPEIRESGLDSESKSGNGLMDDLYPSTESNTPGTMKTISDNSYIFFSNQELRAYAVNGTVSIQVFDVNGRRVMNVSSASNTGVWNLNSLSSGVYFAVMNNNTEYKCKINIIK